MVCEEPKKRFRTTGEKSTLAEPELRQQAGILQLECNLAVSDARNDLASTTQRHQHLALVRLQAFLFTDPYTVHVSKECSVRIVF